MVYFQHSSSQRFSVILQYTEQMSQISNDVQLETKCFTVNMRINKPPDYITFSLNPLTLSVQMETFMCHELFLKCFNLLVRVSTNFILENFTISRASC